MQSDSFNSGQVEFIYSTGAMWVTVLQHWATQDLNLAPKGLRIFNRVKVYSMDADDWNLCYWMEDLKCPPPPPIFWMQFRLLQPPHCNSMQIYLCSGLCQSRWNTIPSAVQIPDLKCRPLLSPGIPIHPNSIQITLKVKCPPISMRTTW